MSALPEAEDTVPDPHKPLYDALDRARSAELELEERIGALADAIWAHEQSHANREGKRHYDDFQEPPSTAEGDSDG